MKTKFLLFLVLFSNNHLIFSQTPAIERDALIALYNATDGPNWTDNTNWNTAAPVNTWFGVTTNATGNVIGIDLNPTNNTFGSNNLTGTIQPEIGDLSFLEILDLSFNNISGTLPIEIINLTNLELLDLSSNQLTGTIPNSISLLSNLETLDLSFNQLSGVIPVEITTLTNLRFLALRNCLFTGFIYPEYGNLINLETLRLDANNLTGIIPVELGNLTSLIDLIIGNQDLTGNLPVSLGNLLNIRDLVISDTSLDGSIPLEYGNLVNLQNLWLQNNNLSGTIPDTLGGIASIINIILSGNNLTGDIPNTFVNGSNLNGLFLQGNNLTGNIPNSLLNCLDLTNVFLSSNNLEGTIPNFTSLSNIDILSISNNNFQFGDFENQYTTYTGYTSFNNSPQAKVNTEDTIDEFIGNDVSLTTTVSGTQNTYQWYRGIYPAGALIPGATNADLSITNAQATDAGEYYCLINSNIVTDLTLVRNQITLNISPSCDTADRNALIALYNATDGPNWFENTNWNTAAPLDTWFGVTTDVNGCVIAIEMPRGIDGNNLSGMLPDELGNLSQLQRLNLSFNGVGLNGNLPSTIGLLSNLEALLLTDNGLTGNLITEITSLSNLRQLYLGQNNLSGTIPFNITTMPSLELLQLSNNNFSGFIYPEYSNITTLRELSLSANQLTGTIPIELGTLPNLEILSLGFQDITGNIPAELGNITTLRQLNLRFSNLGGNIPNTLLALNNLEQAFFDNNQLEGVIPDFTSLANLGLLFFGNNRFQFGDFENQHPVYSTYNTYNNNPQAKVDIVETINDVIGNDVTLTTTLSGTQNTYQWYRGVYPAGTPVAGATNANLTITNAQTTDAGDYYCLIDSNIVTDLTLVRNQITLNLSVSCATTNRDALMALYNATDGPNWTNNTNWGTNAPLDTWFGVSTDANGCVTALDLNPTNDVAGSNNLTGILPEELGDLQSLTILDLAIGNLTGPLPANITTLSDLSFLNIFSNNLTGTIPNNIGDLTNLQSLRLGQNELIGTIPLSITTLSNLTELELRVNNLTGTIPIEITNMIALRRLSLDSNNFTGFIYPEYGNLINLMTLSLSSNQLTGQIPTELGNLINMIDLRLGSQDLTGTLPASIANMSNLQFLVIRNTLITGIIPPEYGNLTNLRWLLLSENQLNGNIPTELGNLSNLQLLHLRDNELTGNIQPELVNLSSLQQLLLGSNELSGQIPDLTIIASLGALSFDDNNFQFGDFENQHSTYATYSLYDNNPQAKINAVETIEGCTNQSVTLTTTASGSQNTYQWYRGVHPSGTLLAGETNPDLIFTNAQLADSDEYYCEVNSNIVTDLALIRNQITLSITDSNITANPINPINVCDNDNDGFESFPIDIADIESQVLGGQTGLTIDYFDASDMPITLTNPYTNTTIDTQTITVRVSNNSGCFEETTLDLIVNPTPDVDVIADQNECAQYVLPNLTNGNYYTETGGNGTQLNAGDVITNSQTIFIYNETGTVPNSCSNESNFNVTITGNPPVDMIDDQESCDQFVLPTLVNGNYFTETNAGGTPLNAGDVITTSQTIFIFNSTANCQSETSFNITINNTEDFELSEQTIEIDEGTLDVNISNTVVELEYSIDGFNYQLNPQFTNLAEGNYVLYVRDVNGCLEKTIAFTITLTRFTIPNFFTPNGDGQHDFWQILDDANTVRTIYIFDRYGKLVKQLSPTSNGWDGTYNGNPLPNSDYWYSVDLNDGKQFQGHFTLKR